MYCNGKDVFDSMNAMAEAREYTIANQKPVLMHANCVRIGSHSNSDKHTLYRDENELKYVKEADPLHKFRRMLLRYKRFTEEELQAIEAEVKKEVSAANKKALAAPDPDPKSIFDFVIPEPYKPEKYVDGTHNEEGEKKNLVTAINETLKAEFRHNPDTFLWGQDVANKDKGGVQRFERHATRVWRKTYFQRSYCRRLYRGNSKWHEPFRPENTSCYRRC